MATDTPAPPVRPDEERYAAVQESAEFGALRKAFRGFVFPTTIAFLLWYALYVVLSAYARDFMSTRLIGHVNVALIFGLLQFVSTFLIAWGYTRFADNKFDPPAARLREDVEGGGRA